LTMPSGPAMRRVDLRNIRLTDSFWTRWQSVLRETTIETQYLQLVKTGRLRNFANAGIAGGEGEKATAALCDQTGGKVDPAQGGFTGYYFNDSDVYKWCEAAAYALALGPDVRIQKRLDEVIGLIEGAQEPDGYLNTFFQIKHPHLKWRNLLSMHEMYCAGHLIEAGVALFETTGDKRLLIVAARFADHIKSIFGPGKRRGYCGHEEIELALIRLSAATNDPTYRSLASWMIEERGKSPSVLEQELDDDEAMTMSPWAAGMLRKHGKYIGEYSQDHAPIREHTEVVGHAVRAMYLYIAAAQLSGDDPTLIPSLERMWHNLTTRRMYITGGIGPSSSNEGFTADYDLPNLTAYAETCAACGLVFWGHSLLEATGNSDHADIVERALYNGAISGISLSGDKYFYTNPLESRGSHERVPWFDCACCPPNIARLIGNASSYVVSQSEGAFWIHIPAGFEADVTIKGVAVHIRCESNYPWSGKFEVNVEPASPVDFELRLRIPDWADEVETELPGLGKESEWDQGYAVFAKIWSKGDVMKVDLGMQPKWTESHPKVKDNLGRIALTRGPLVYCLEEHDLGFAPQLFVADTEAPLTESVETMLEGITTVAVEGFADKEDFADELYAAEGTLEMIEAVAKFVPYYAWCNRGPNNMQVWVRRA
jgi:DUF1680 family protein